MMSLRSLLKISNYLARANLCPLDRAVGLTRRGKKWCKVCMNH